MLPTAVVPVEPVETEVLAKPKRRQFTAEYKKKVLEEADAAKGDLGRVGEILRREGLYSSHLTEWRRARERGQLAGLAPKRRGPVGRRPDPKDRRIAELEGDIRKLRARAERAEALVELQKKVSEILGIPLPESDGTKS